MKYVIPALALLLTAQTAQARPGGHGKHGKHEGLNPRMIERAADLLDLDEATRRQVKDLVYTSQKEAVAVRARLEEARIELRRLLDDPDPDRGAVMRRVEQVGDLQVTMRKNKLGLFLDVRALLTPEQVRKLKTMRHELREQRRSRREGRRGERRKQRRRGRAPQE